MKTVTMGSANRWLRAAARLLAGGVLMTAPVLGITCFAGDFWPTVQAVWADESISTGPLTFDSPSATVVKTQAAQTKPAPAAQNNGDKVLLLNDWKFTHSQYQ